MDLNDEQTPVVVRKVRTIFLCLAVALLVAGTVLLVRSVLFVSTAERVDARVTSFLGTWGITAIVLFFGLGCGFFALVVSSLAKTLGREQQGTSSQPSRDPHLIEETKQQILMLVHEIEQFAKSDISPEEFYAEFLPRVLSALAAAAGAVWMADDRGRLALEYHKNLRQALLGESEENQAFHGRLVQRVLAAGEAALVSPHSGSADDEQGGNPTDFLLVLAPLKAAGRTVGVVEIFQRPNTRPATQRGYLRFLTEMCDRASEFLGPR